MGYIHTKPFALPDGINVRPDESFIVGAFEICEMAAIDLCLAPSSLPMELHQQTPAKMKRGHDKRSKEHELFVPSSNPFCHRGSNFNIQMLVADRGIPTCFLKKKRFFKATPGTQWHGLGN